MQPKISNFWLSLALSSTQSLIAKTDMTYTDETKYRKKAKIGPLHSSGKKVDKSADFRKICSRLFKHSLTC